MDARGWGAHPWTYERFLLAQRTGCWWMGRSPLGPRAIPTCSRIPVDGALSHGPMSDSHLRSGQDARGCSWMGAMPNWLMSDSYLRSAQDACACSWMGCSPMDP